MDVCYKEAHSLALPLSLHIWDEEKNRGVGMGSQGRGVNCHYVDELCSDPPSPLPAPPPPAWFPGPHVGVDQPGVDLLSWIALSDLTCK